MNPSTGTRCASPSVQNNSAHGNTLNSQQGAWKTQHPALPSTARKFRYCLQPGTSVTIDLHTDGNFNDFRCLPSHYFLLPTQQL